MHFVIHFTTSGVPDFTLFVRFYSNSGFPYEITLSRNHLERLLWKRQGLGGGDREQEMP